MNRIQEFLKRKGIEDKIVDYDESNEPFTPSYIIQEWEKEQLALCNVSNRRELLRAYEKFTDPDQNIKDAEHNISWFLGE